MNSYLKKEQHNSKDALKEVILLIKGNYILILVLILIINLGLSLYLINATVFYDAKTIIKFSKPQGSLLSANVIPGLEEITNDKYVAAEIEVMKTYPMRLKAAEIILDSVRKYNENEKLYYLLKDLKNPQEGLISKENLAKMLSFIVTISQKKGLVILDLIATSPSQFESYIISNAYALAYSEYILNQSKEDLTNTLAYVAREKQKKYNDLNIAEASLEEFQKKTGLLNVQAQTESLIDDLSDMDKERGLANINLVSITLKNRGLTEEIKKIDPQLITFLEGEMSNNYIIDLQKSISDLEIQKQQDLQSTSDPKLKQRIINDYDSKLAPLKDEYKIRYENIKSAMYSQTPVERRKLVEELIESDIAIKENTAKLSSIDKLISKYELEFKKLPANATEYAKLSRERTSSEKLYLILEEKYQELMINQNARVGNVSIIEPALKPVFPSKPDKGMIILYGFLASILGSIGFVYLKNYLDRTIKTPDQLEKIGVPLLAWIPSFDSKNLKIQETAANSNVNKSSSINESFKVLRTRILFSKLEEKKLKTILITSSIPSEGKTTVSVNLATSFAMNNNKTLLIDCDLRKPRIHSFMEQDRYPGLSDHLISNLPLSEVIRKSPYNNLDFITSGTIPPNPSELLASMQMSNFLDKMREKYDFIIVDSPPALTVTDSEILFKILDGTVLVTQANKSPIDAFQKVFERFKSVSEHHLLGVVLNNFSFRTSYGYYYDYYYSYSSQDLKPKKSL